MSKKAQIMESVMKFSVDEVTVAASQLDHIKGPIIAWSESELEGLLVELEANKAQQGGGPLKSHIKDIVSFEFFPASTTPEPDTEILIQNEFGAWEIGWYSAGGVDCPLGYCVSDFDRESREESWALIECKRWAYLPKEK